MSTLLFLQFNFLMLCTIFLVWLLILFSLKWFEYVQYIQSWGVLPFWLFIENKCWHSLFIIFIYSKFSNTSKQHLCLSLGIQTVYLHVHTRCWSFSYLSLPNDGLKQLRCFLLLFPEFRGARNHNLYKQVTLLPIKHAVCSLCIFSYLQRLMWFEFQDGHLQGGQGLGLDSS